ncbi:PAS domain-containing sensor histidine kinase [Gorillibacterium timonense]|uniref:PAS domain-containing sensor histidine kinase n=1 Tax=Gorillibacterium timonense TaxID=1689269 RepID=UPI000AF59AE2|nr:PAS domain-containing sensor histidine kinase [Gorillibacterium timonense]
MSSPQNWCMHQGFDFLAGCAKECRQHAYLVCDNKKVIMNGCPVLLERLGYDQGDLLGMPLETLFEDGKLSDIVWEELLAGRGDGIRIMLRGKAGNGFETSITTERIVDVKEEREWFLLGFPDLLRDPNLNLLQQFAGAFMKDINLGVLLIDPSYCLVDISDTACRILGFPRENVIGKPIEKIFASLPAEHQIVDRSILDGVIVRNHAASWMNNEERYDLLLDSNVLKDHEGRTVGAYMMFKDVTNLRSLEEQVKRSDRLAMIGQIAAGTAHEIRNPLTSIKGFLQVLNNTFHDKGMEKERSYTEIMLTEINRINDLVSEFLLLGKRKNVSYHEVELQTTLREILPIIHNEAILHNVNVYYEAIESCPKVIADRELLKQVFLNISKNGIEAMSDGGNLTIGIRTDTEDRFVLVEIRDTGPGIPNFLIDKIFDPFFTTKSEGTGLGLSVCQRIVHDMGGTIRVSSKGFGTTFTVCIPYM